MTFTGGESLELEARGDVPGFVAAFEQHRNITPG
jgi:hypothetical protein